jgi:hypothetical protein
MSACLEFLAPILEQKTAARHLFFEFGARHRILEKQQNATAEVWPNWEQVY